MGSTVIPRVMIVAFCFSLTGLSSLASGDDCSNQSPDRLRAQIAQDQTAIRSLGFERQVKDIQEWQKLSTDARSEMMSSAFDLLLASIQSAVKAGSSLNPPSANRTIGRLRSAGISSETLDDAIRKVASTPGKPATAEELKYLLDSFGRSKDTIMMATSDRTSALENLSTVLGWFQTNTTLALLASDLQFTTASIYNNVTRRESKQAIEQLASLTESDLKSLKRLTAQLDKNVKTLNALGGSGTRQPLIDASNATTASLNACYSKMFQCRSSCAGSPDLGGCYDACGNCDAEQVEWNKSMQAVGDFDQNHAQGMLKGAPTPCQ